jgi:hypothetical protein
MSSQIVIEAGKMKQKGWYFPLCSNSRTMTFSFTESCKYDVRGVGNQTNIHKLFGIGVFHVFGSFKTTKTKKWWELHKWHSIRLGWRYNPIEDVFEITDYCYINGIGDRSTTDNVIVKVKEGDIVTVEIIVKKGGFALHIIDNDGGVYVIEKSFKTPFFLCVPFFIRLRAYVELPIPIKQDMIINKLKKP